jgi:hypothetical protein
MAAGANSLNLGAVSHKGDEHVYRNTRQNRRVPDGLHDGGLLHVHQNGRISHMCRILYRFSDVLQVREYEAW